MKKDTQGSKRILGEDVKEARFTNTQPVSGNKLETPHLLIYSKSETVETEKETFDGEGNPVKKSKEAGTKPQVF